VGGARFGSFVFRVPLFLSGIEFELIAWFLAFFGGWLVGLSWVGFTDKTARVWNVL
jgi:hypothetical protein